MSEVIGTNDDEGFEPAAMPSEIETLKARADLLGISYHPAIGVEKLRVKINEALSDEPPKAESAPQIPVPVAVEAAVETDAQRRIRKRREASELIRVRIQCMNPAKKEWSGEIFTVSNALVGTMSKYVPFIDADDGWHVPRMIYNQLVERQCQVFVTVTDERGNKTRKGKLIKEFAVEVLPNLTAEELKDLAQQQAMAKVIA